MDETKQWMEKAKRDLNAAGINLNENLFDVCAFLAQQASEKALKALYIQKFKKLLKIHDLYELGKKIGATKEILDACERLNPHYIATRYPSDENYTRELAEEALSDSKKVVEWANKAIAK